MSDHKFISISGYPGIGKGYAISKYLEKNTFFYHISYGDTMRKYEMIDENVKRLRSIALDPNNSERDKAFRDLEHIFVKSILPKELINISKNKIIILDNFPVHIHGLREMNTKYSLMLVIHVQTKNDNLLVDRMLSRSRNDSNDRESALSRIRTYKNIVIPNLNEMATLYNRRTKEFVIDCDDLVNKLSSYLDMISEVCNLFKVKVTKKETLVYVNNVDMVHRWISFSNKYNLPQAYINTISGKVTQQLNLHSINISTLDREFYLLKNPKYVDCQYYRFIAWPLLPNSTQEPNNKIDVYTTSESSISRQKTPTNIVECILLNDKELKSWQTSFRSLQEKGRQYVSKILSVPPEDIGCFVHYPGASYYSVIHIHFTYQFDYSYDRAHSLNKVLDDIDSILNNSVTREEILEKYSSYTTSFFDFYSFYECMCCGSYLCKNCK